LEAADRSGVGVEEIFRFEEGEIAPDRLDLIRLRALCGCSVE
jgi:hypothetical protein